MTKNPQVVAALRADLERLKAELSANPTFQMIQRIEDFLRFYEGEPPKPRTPPVSFPLPTPPSQKTAIKQAVTELIRKSGGVAKRSYILEQLVTAGLIKTKKPIKTLAPILSEAREFVSDGKGSWRLTDQTPEPPQNVDTKREALGRHDGLPRAH